MQNLLAGISLSVIPMLSLAQYEAKLQASQLFEEARYLAAIHEPATALIRYEEGLRSDPWAFHNYLDAFSQALLIRDTSKANDLLRAGVRHGLDPRNFSGMEDLNDFLSTPGSASYHAHLAQDQRAFAAVADSALILSLDSLAKLDQRYRTGREEDQPLMIRTDSLNFEYLIEHCERSGFPDPRTLGHGIGDLHLLLWHHRGAHEYPNSPHWKRIMPQIQEAIETGRLTPYFLCSFEDFAAFDKGEPMPYGTLLGYFSQFPEHLYFVDRQTLDANRERVGLGPVDQSAAILEVDLGLARFAPKP